MDDVELKISLKALINLISEAQQQANVVITKAQQQTKAVPKKKQQQQFWPNPHIQTRKSQKTPLSPRLQAQKNLQRPVTRNFTHIPVSENQHFSQRPWKFNQSSPFMNVLCYSCGFYGHYTANCPIPPPKASRAAPQEKQRYTYFE